MEELTTEESQLIAKKIFARAILDSVETTKSVESKRKHGMCNWSDVTDSRVWLLGRKDRESLEYWSEFMDVSMEEIIEFAKDLSRYYWDRVQLSSLKAIEFFKKAHLMEHIFVLEYTQRRKHARKKSIFL